MTVLLSSCLMASFAVSQGIPSTEPAADAPAVKKLYKVLDKQGNVTYTDLPPKEDATEMALPIINSRPVVDVPAVNFGNGREPVFQYTSLTILVPTADQIIKVNTDTLTISASLQPDLQSSQGHTLQLLMDGKVVAENTASTNVGQVERGTHSISAKVVDKNGQTLIEAPAVNVHAQQATVLNPSHPLYKKPVIAKAKKK
ncbi:MAG: hypothetical protein H0W44_03005 [Gammaproteobacteria bacterium]|nr:hypothetical protein [Gammaproteobacteria bacterium]